MAAVAWRLVLGRCGLTHEAVHAICEEGESITSDLFHTADLKVYMIHLRNSSDGDDKDSGELVAKPSKFLNNTRFPSWQCKLMNYLGDKMGKMGTPLSYVI
eukprot:scaffold53150_cov59-Attheya_sp.AAC.4